MTEEWGELNINWHLEAFGAFTRRFGLPMVKTVNFSRIINIIPNYNIS
jgi:hypothetical protein